MQTLRLGDFLTRRDGADLTFTHIFSSDLRRAAHTARAIFEAQSAYGQREYGSSFQVAAGVVQLSDLQEVNFGSREGLTYNPNLHFKDDRETFESMVSRADRFINAHLLPVLQALPPPPSGVNPAIAIVSHGIFLSVLWRQLMQSRPAHYVPSTRLTNTGFISLIVPPTKGGTRISDWPLQVRDINVTTHLSGLKRAPDASAEFDGRQRKIESYFPAI